MQIDETSIVSFLKIKEVSMFKKFIVTASIVCVVIGTLSSLVFADYGIRGHGIDCVHNG